MKRFHVHISVDDLTKSIRFYSTLFGADLRGSRPITPSGCSMTRA
jgi:catechol 2,3-dioxygenase-like lactoylglutathione lyase family enzyme